MVWTYFIPVKTICVITGVDRFHFYKDYMCGMERAYSCEDYMSGMGRFHFYKTISVVWTYSILSRTVSVV